MIFSAPQMRSGQARNEAANSAPASAGLAAAAKLRSSTMTTASWRAWKAAGRGSSPGAVTHQRGPGQSDSAFRNDRRRGSRVLPKDRALAVRSAASGRFDREVVLYGFDLLELNGDDLRSLPPEQRNARLAELLAPVTGGIELSEHIEADGAIVFLHACKLGCEDIVSKRRDAPYRSGRVWTWIKVKSPASPAIPPTMPSLIGSLPPACVAAATAVAPTDSRASSTRRARCRERRRRWRRRSNQG